MIYYKQKYEPERKREHQVKENLLTKTAKMALYLTSAYIEPGDFVIDATCGNGNDTLTLANAVGSSGRVLAMDLQEQAVAASKARLSEEGIENAAFVCGNFIHMQEYARTFFPEKRPKAVVFNLGYLPGGDKSLTTKAEETCQAAEKALELIEPGGIVTLVLYPGHPAGREEREAILQMAEKLPSSVYHTMYASLPNQKNNPPEILWITKKRERKEDRS